MYGSSSPTTARSPRPGRTGSTVGSGSLVGFVVMVCGPAGSALVDPDDPVEQLQGVRLLALEGVAADDRAEAAPLVDAADLVEHGVVRLGRASGKDDDPAAVEGALDDVTHPFGGSLHRNLLFQVDLAGGLLLDVRGGKLDLDDVRPELGGDLGGIAGDVNGGLPLLAQTRAARVGPDHDDQPVALGLLGVGPNPAV